MEERFRYPGVKSFAENEKDSPWKPYHVDLGFKAEDSTVTVTNAMFWQRGPGGGVHPGQLNQYLMGIASVIANIQ